MLRRIIIKSLLARRRHLLVAGVAVLLGTTLIASLVTLSLGMKTQAARELEAYGANVILLPEAMSLPAGAGGLAFGDVASEGYIAEKHLGLLEAGQLREVKSYTPYLYAVAKHEGQGVVVTGTVFDKLREMSSFWHIKGELPDTGSTEVIIGTNVAARFSLRPGDTLSLDFSGVSQEFTVTGVADVGGSEDSQVFGDLGTVQVITGRSGQVDLVQVRASTEDRPLGEIAADLERNLRVRAKVVSQVADAEETVLFKIQLLMGLIAVLTFLASGVAVFSTLTSSVLERVKEIGLMKSLGAKNSRIAVVFLAESWTIGLAGGVAGTVLGLGMAQAIAKSVFDLYLSLRPVVAPLTLVAALALATVAAIGPVRNALAVDPIVTLRGE